VGRSTVTGFEKKPPALATAIEGAMTVTVQLTLPEGGLGTQHTLVKTAVLLEVAPIHKPPPDTHTKGSCGLKEM
jgi:hypothetical protein